MGGKLSKYKNKREDNDMIERIRYNSILESPLPNGWQVMYTANGDKYLVIAPISLFLD